MINLIFSNTDLEKKYYTAEEKVKSHKYRTQRKIQNGKSIIKRQNQNLKHINQIDNSSHIPGSVRAFSYVENGELNLGLKLAKPLT